MLSFNLKVQQLYWLFPWRASSNNCCKTAARLASRCLMETRLVTYSCKLLARALCSGPASRLRQRTDEPPNSVACLTRIPRVNWGVFLQLNWLSFWLTLMPQVRDVLMNSQLTPQGWKPVVAIDECQVLDSVFGWGGFRSSYGNETWARGATQNLAQTR